MHEFHVDALAVVADDKSGRQNDDMRSQGYSSRIDPKSLPYPESRRGAPSLA
jgi:hypothetical protein